MKKKAEIGEFTASEEYKKYEQFLEEKKKTIKHGTNVVHIEYVDGILVQEDLNEIELELNKSKLTLSSYDKAGVIYASLEEYKNLINVVLRSEIIMNILVYNVLASIFWETIKSIYKKFMVKLKTSIIKTLGTKNLKDKLTFGIHVIIDNNNQYYVRLNSSFSESEIELVMEKAIKFIKKQNFNLTYKHPLFLYYNLEDKKIIKVDMIKDI